MRLTIKKKRRSGKHDMHTCVCVDTTKIITYDLFAKDVEVVEFDQGTIRTELILEYDKGLASHALSGPHAHLDHLAKR